MADGAAAWHCPRVRTVQHIVSWLDAFLDPQRVDDYGPNGLQVEASDHVTRIVTGVTANLAFIEAAADMKADLAVVHHGLYWGNRPSTATGSLGRRLRALFAHRLSLAAYHLPLDGHLEVGNAANLARALGLRELVPAFPSRGIATGVVGRFDPPLDPATVAERITALAPRAVLFEGGPARIKKVGLVTGGAPRLAEDAAKGGLDLYVTGEATEFTQAMAREEGIHIAAMGHHRSEVFGPRALAERLRQEFPGLEVEFVDIDNPA